MAGFVTWFSVLPFLVPALIKERLSNLQTKFDKNGVCRQTTGYTCGPAAAVTALGKLGLRADEGELAVLSYSSPVIGTLPSCLTSALRDRYSADGLNCQYRRFDSIDQLRNAGVTLVVVRDTFLLDHCIAVLDVSDDAIIVADPISGARLMPYKQFEKIWRFCGIVLQRNLMQRI
jgi:predicted double-glycine peptidase